MDKIREEHEEIAGKLGLSGYWLYVFPDECPHCGALLWAKIESNLTTVASFVSIAAAKFSASK